MAKSKKSDFQKLLEATDSKTLIGQATKLAQTEAAKLIWNDGVRVILAFAANDPKRIDFVNEDGRLLQVKNRSNSENSSSSRVRKGTKIEKWFRVNANTGKYLWEDLNKLHTNLKLSEEKFKSFVVKTLKANPKAMPVESANPWNKKES